MKKIVKSIVALCIVSSMLLPQVSVFAANLASDENLRSIVTKFRDSKSIGGETGNLNVQIDLRLPTEKNPNFHLTLDDKEPNVSSQSGTTYYYDFTDVPVGTYTLTITADGYATYTQSITLKNENAEIRITNSHDADEVSSIAMDKIGVMGIGDVTGDGSISQADVEEMIRQIKSGSNLEKYDLNQDGYVDIVDLSYVMFNQKENQEAQVLHHLNMANVIVAPVDENTEVEGNLESILKNNEEYVSLKPQNELEISKENPVSITLKLPEQEEGQGTEAIVIAPAGEPENNIKGGSVVVQAEDGEEYEIPIQSSDVETRSSNPQSVKTVNIDGTISVRTIPYAAKVLEGASVKVASDGSIVIDLGQQIAIKKITINVTATGSNRLADISKVEFLNDMKDYIPEPEMAKPTGLSGTVGSKKITLTWDNMNNVTGYEVAISSNGSTEYQRVETNTITITSFGGKELKNLTTYEVKVQSINGNWKSGFCDAKSFTPKPAGVPPKPDYVNAVGEYKSLYVEWKQMDDTDSYTVYYRKKGETAFQVAVENTSRNNCRIENLADNTSYEAYVVGKNEYGEGPNSDLSEATTISLEAAELPNYNLLNTSNGYGKVTEHIKYVTFHTSNQQKRQMVDSPLDENSNPKTAYGVVDNSYTSYFQVDDWDVGGVYEGDKAPTIEFDQAYTMNYFTLAQVENVGNITSAIITYYQKDADGNEKAIRVKAPDVMTKQDSNGRYYTAIRLNAPITTHKINIGVGTPSTGYVKKITIAEIHFHLYDELDQKVDDLFTDQMHLEVAPGVTLGKIEEIKKELNSHTNAGEFHPEKDKLLAEVNFAEQLLKDTAVKEILTVDSQVTKKQDSHITFSSGLNDWQPLGIVAMADETVTIYVGNSAQKRGDKANLELIATQYHAEANKWQTVVTQLVVGENTVTIPSIISGSTTGGIENGGSLYVRYTGDAGKQQYYVRTSGGHKIPTLDLTKVERTDVTKRKQLVKEYIQALEAYLPTISSEHTKLHPEYTWKEENCILGATEIVLDQVMYSVSAKMIYEPLKNAGSLEAKTEKLYQSLVAMEEMIDLFYAHKGLSTSSQALAINRYPVSRLNIRYHRMFAGAFMYAGGLHIGIEWGSVSGLSNGVPMTFVEGKEGKYQSGSYFGWGIAHEIGHIINEGDYAVAEVTNNYFSVLAQAEQAKGKENESVRFVYDNVYEKVTSGTIGRASNVFTQLGLYWQLHLAYDKGYNYKTYQDPTEQFNNLFFARVDTYARALKKENSSVVLPGKDGNKLTLAGAENGDNKLMRLAVAAAQKNILSFFERWGMVPDETTKAYAAQFEKEERPIYYINDEARLYQLEGGNPMSGETTVKATLEYLGGNQVKITMSNTASDQNAILGYEVSRSYQENDQTITRAVAFLTVDKAVDGVVTYTDTIYSVNHRVFTYEVKAVDKYLNTTASVYAKKADSDDPQVKISHEGNIAKSGWTIETNLVSEEDKWVDLETGKATDIVSQQTATTVTSSDSLCEPEQEKAINKILNQRSDDYVGSVEEGNGEIILSLGGKTRIVALKYTAGTGNPIKEYEIYISDNQNDWDKVKEGTFSLSEDKTATVYFDKEDENGKLMIYDASYVKLVIKNAIEGVSIDEIDLLGQTGDDVELLVNGIGILEKDYCYDKGQNLSIPAGSLIFTGTYVGNPCYNAVKVWGGDVLSTDSVERPTTDKLVASETEDKTAEIFLAPFPEDGQFGGVSNGTWIYWIEPDDGQAQVQEKYIPKAVRVELYRVDEAYTLTGERLVADTYRIAVPEQLPKITITAEPNP